MLFRTTRVRCKTCNAESDNVDCVNSQQDPQEELRCLAPNHHNLGGAGSPVSDVQVIKVEFGERDARTVLNEAYPTARLPGRSYAKPTQAEVARVETELDELQKERDGEPFSDEEKVAALAALQRVKNRYRPQSAA